jgi:hypothetical protein
MMNASKLELYDHHSQIGSNGLPHLMSTNPTASSITASDSSDSEQDDDRDGSRKRKRPMNVTYVLDTTPRRCLTLEHISL